MIDYRHHWSHRFQCLFGDALKAILGCGIVCMPHWMPKSWHCAVARRAIIRKRSDGSQQKAVERFVGRTPTLSRLSAAVLGLVARIHPSASTRSLPGFPTALEWTWQYVDFQSGKDGSTLHRSSPRSGQIPVQRDFPEGHSPLSGAACGRTSPRNRIEGRLFFLYPGWRNERNRQSC